MPTEQTPQLVLFDILLVLLIFITLRRTLRKPFRISEPEYYLAIFFGILFCLFSFWGTDWFHYIEVYEKLQKGKDSHVEEIYYWIAGISPNYIVFRLFIWGSALLLFVDITRRLSVSKELAFILFGCMYLTWFSYARASLAMVMAYYGYSLILKPYRNKRFSIILAITAILGSFYFHKSSLFAIATVSLCVLIKKYPTKAVVMCLMMYPLLIMFAKSQLADIMSSDIDANESDLSSYMSSSQHYLDAKATKRGIGAIIMGKLESIPYYMVAFLSFFALKNYRRLIPQDIKGFMLLTILLLIFSSIFTFDLGFNTGMFYGRFIKFLAIPSSIVLAYLYQNRIYPRLTKASLLIGVLGTAYALLYTFYCSIVGGQ